MCRAAGALDSAYPPCTPTQTLTSVPAAVAGYLEPRGGDLRHAVRQTAFLEPEHEEAFRPVSESCTHPAPPCTVWEFTGPGVSGSHPCEITPVRLDAYPWVATVTQR